MSRPFHVRTLKSQLTIWFGGIALAVLLVAGYYLHHVAGRELAALQGETLYARAEAAATQLVNQVKERELDVSILAQAPHVMRAEWSNSDVLTSLSNRRKARPEYAWLGITDARGVVTVATDDFLLGADVSSRTWFQAGRNGPFVGDVHEAVLLARLVQYQVRDGDTMRFIDFAAPIWKDGVLQGVVGAHVHWDWVWQTAVRALEGHADMGSNVELLIFDGQGHVVYPSRLANTRLPSAGSDALRYGMLEWSDGLTWLASVVPVPPTASTSLGWKVVLRQPRADAIRTVVSLRYNLLWLGLLGVAAVGVAAYRTARHIARPLEQITQAAQQIEAGKADVQFPTDLDILEVEQLNRSLQTMTQTLQAHEHELEAKVKQRTAQLEDANAQLERLSVTDVLTGLYNRRRLEERLLEWLQLFHRTGHAFGLLVLDIDHFKSVNDTWGHDAGDEVLKRFARVVAGAVRNTDMVARFGGEEFVVLLPDTPDIGQLCAVAEKIRDAVETAEFPIPRQVTASIGAAICQNSDTGAGDILKRADVALYEAKRGGRNRVVVAGP